jgi:hypothetical protein
MLRDPVHLLQKIRDRVPDLAGLFMLDLAQRLPNHILRDCGGNSAVPLQVADVLQNHNHVIDEQLLAVGFQCEQRLRIEHLLEIFDFRVDHAELTLMPTL